MMRRLPSAMAAMILAAGYFSSAEAADPTAIGRYGAWQALTFDEGGSKGCYVFSEPKQMEGKYSSRGKVYTLVTHRPGSKQLNVVTIIAGYTYKPESEVVVEIGDETFKLFTDKGTAWTPTADSDQRMVDAMKNGSEMKVHGISARDTETVDTYSLQGFTKAYSAINEACGL
jgi:Invasion associated locus B (IalB) protein